VVVDLTSFTANVVGRKIFQEIYLLTLWTISAVLEKIERPRIR
jgi:hypothetical protein